MSVLKKKNSLKKEIAGNNERLCVRGNNCDAIHR